MKERHNYDYVLHLDDAQLGVVQTAIDFDTKLRSGNLSCVADLIETWGVAVKNQNIPVLRYNLEHWQERVTLGRPIAGEPLQLPSGVGSTWPRIGIDRLQRILSLFYRTLMCQFEHVDGRWSHYAYSNIGPSLSREEFGLFRNSMSQFEVYANGLESGAYFGIAHHSYSDYGRIAADVYDVIRNRLACDDNPIERGITVDFDEPHHWSKNRTVSAPLARIRPIGVILTDYEFADAFCGTIFQLVEDHFAANDEFEVVKLDITSPAANCAIVAHVYRAEYPQPLVVAVKGCTVSFVTNAVIRTVDMSSPEANGDIATALDYCFNRG